MLARTRLTRGLGVAVVSIFLVAGAAFAADGIVNPPRESGPVGANATDDHSTAQPSESAEPTETAEPSESAEPTETAEAADTAEPTETAETNDDNGQDGQGEDHGSGTVAPTDDHGGTSGHGGDDGGSDDGGSHGGNDH